MLINFCEQLGLPRAYGDPRSGRMDCAVIHEGKLWGCEANAIYRFTKGFIKIFPVNLKVVHILFFAHTKVLRFI